MPDDKHTKVTCYDCNHVFAGINGKEQSEHERTQQIR